jgi:preprotein translocase subunit SecB
MNNLVKIDLQKYCIEELTIKAPINSGLSNIPPKVETKLTNQVQISKDDNKRNFRISIQSDISFKGAPDYSIKCKVTGDFAFLEECPDEEKDRLIKHTAPFVLFDIMREIVSTLSAKTPYFPVILPILEFTQTSTEEK